jgi:diguanylate cyclase (GGDEF)-like protein
MSAMTAVPMAPGSEEQYVSAVHRLADARREESRLVDLHAAAAGTRAEVSAQERVSAAHAVVASREEWLHWIDEGESIAPWADGEWSPDARTSRPLPWDNATNPDVRDAMARGRDRASAERDRVADVRDRLAQAHEAGVKTGPGAGEYCAAASQRAASAIDREHALSDRERSAHDREHAACARVAAGNDDLTGALRRGVGLAAVQRDLERCHRTDDRLVLAFVDVDGLKAVNDSLGHAAGDRLLEAAAERIRVHMRPYDVIVRVGGDEFVCALTGIGMDGVEERFDLVSADLAAAPAAGSISVGLAELTPGESMDDLIRRADAALLAVKGVRGGASRSARRSGRSSPSDRTRTQGDRPSTSA